MVAVLSFKKKIMRRRRVIAAVFALVATFGAVVTGLQVLAADGGSSGTGDGAHGGSCAPAGTTVWWDTCYGVTWRKYPADSDSITINGTSNTPGGTVKNCKTYGGEYYRLAFEAYNPSTLTSLGYQKGLVPVNKVTPPKGTGFYNFKYLADDPNSMSWEQVESDFKRAQDYFRQKGMPDFPTDWQSTAWFCWDKEIDNPQTKFQSKSSVTDGSATSTSLSWDADAPDLEIQADQSGNASVTFSHQLKYDAGTPSGEYENASTRWTISTDTLSNVTDTWSTPGKVTAESSWLPVGQSLTVNVTLGENETEKRVCSTISYITKTLGWSNDNPHKMQPNNDNGSTKACAVIKQNPVQTTGGILFWPQSSVESVAERDVIGHKEWTTDNKDKADGDKVSIQLSTDYDTAKANFQHKIHFEVDMGSYTFGANDTWDTSAMCTTYTVNKADGSTATGTVCPTAPATGSSKSSGATDISGATNFSINVPGSANEKITYQPKTISIQREEIKYSCPTRNNPNRMCSYNPKRWKYYGSGGSGSGNSSAEIEYISPNEPTGEGPSSNGLSGAITMFAGESVAMGWHGEAQAVDTRRVIAYQSIAFQVDWRSSQATSGDLGTKHPRRSQSDPCSRWRTQMSVSGCTQVDPGSQQLNDTNPSGWNSLISVAAGRNLVVPDLVGDKYCNGLGFMWQYFWGVKRISDGGQWNWQPENQTYWTHYDAACRTIAKKPSTAFWNGGVFTQGGVKTTLASRYGNTAVGTIVSGTPTGYGSWTEGLGVIGRGAGSFGTGASLAFGGSSNPYNNSPLTIQNSGILGHSGISPNGTIITRLKSYLANIKTDDSISALYGSSSDGTRIAVIPSAGELNITSNIEVNGSYGNIYTVPQKVIFYDGDKINISSSVTRIDAWIIAPNATINTCSSFSNGDTETLPESSNNPCDVPLQINGPVFARNLELNRSGGADNTHGGWNKYTPAEIFNLSTDSYLWAYAQAGRYGSSYTEAYSRELPPRY